MAYSSLDAGQSYVDANNIEFTPHLWRSGIPDPGITDLGFATKCGPAHNGTVTHLMIWGDLLDSEWQGMQDNIPQCQVFNAEQWTRRQLLNSQGLKQITEEEITIDHYLSMPIMHKIWDIADAPIDISECEISDKFDGHTCALRYEDGELKRGIEQGDSISGLDRTGRLATMSPSNININSRIQIEGEVITNTNDPYIAYYAMRDATKKEFASYDCKFIAFDVRGAGFTTWVEAMAWLDTQGFDTVLNYINEDYPKDGRVYRINNYADYNAAPVGQFALKYY